jgi:polyferredoxin
MRNDTQRRRRLWQSGFFVLFAVAPWFDLFRYDLTAGHAWILTFPWRLGLDEFIAGRASAGQAVLQVVLRLFVPLLTIAGVLLGVAWRWGRLYCGWLCPHFSVVETLNELMLRACGRLSLWERPMRSVEGMSARGHSAHWWLVLILLTIGFAFAWAVVLLSYLLPPATVYGHLWHGVLRRPEALFLGVGTTLLSLEFFFGRHLFCRYACAVGMFQSLAWIANPNAMVVGFSRRRASACADCLPARTFACEIACPMRLKPRALKRHMFACTQCGKCLQSCQTVQSGRPAGTLLRWVDGSTARAREAGFASSVRPDRR